MAACRGGSNVFAAYKRFLDFQGRASRTEYWLFVLVFIIEAVVALAIDRTLFGGDPTSSFGMAGPAYILGVVVNFIPSLSVGFRRLHDTGRSAWWLLISLIPLIGGIVLLIFNLLPSQPGPNRFGPQPGQPIEDLQGTFS